MRYLKHYTEELILLFFTFQLYHFIILVWAQNGRKEQTYSGDHQLRTLLVHRGGFFPSVLFVRLKFVFFICSQEGGKAQRKDLMQNSWDLVNLLRNNINRWIRCCQQYRAFYPQMVPILFLLILPVLSWFHLDLSFYFLPVICFLMFLLYFYFTFHF